MPKEILKITNVKGTICQAELSCDTEEEYACAGASIMSLMVRDEQLASQIVSAATLYTLKKDALAKENERAIRMAEIKMKN